jgi:hypothetical protein
MLRFEVLDTVNNADIRMVQRGSGPRFSLKPLKQAVVAGHRRRKELQGDVPAKLCVLSLVNDTHAAFTEL